MADNEIENKIKSLEKNSKNSSGALVVENNKAMFVSARPSIGFKNGVESFGILPAGHVSDLDGKSDNPNLAGSLEASSVKPGNDIDKLIAANKVLHTNVVQQSAALDKLLVEKTSPFGMLNTSSRGKLSMHGSSKRKGSPLSQYPAYNSPTGLVKHNSQVSMDH